MDVGELKRELTLNLGIVEGIMRELGFAFHSENEREYRFGWDVNSNLTRFTMQKETLFVYDFRDNQSCDILEIVKQKLKYTFSSTVKWIAHKLGVDISGGYVKRIKPFAEELDFLKYVKRQLDISAPTPAIDERFLEDFEPCVSDLFLTDNVGALAQIEMGVRIDYSTNRIVIPVRNEHGHLVGAMGRLNKEEVGKFTAKYLPILPYTRGKVLYGLFENKERIEQVGTAIVVESEKSVIKARGFGIRNVVALGKNSLSSYQLKLLQNLNCKNIILALDEGIDLIHVHKQMEVLKQTGKRVGFISPTVYPCGTKSCLFDFPEEIKEYGGKIIWVDYKN